MSKKKTQGKINRGGYALVPMPVSALTTRPKGGNSINGKVDTTYYNNPILGGWGVGTVQGHNYVTDFAHYVHTNIVIINRWFDQLNPMHRHYLSIHHEFQKANIYKVAHALTDEPPRFVRKSTENDEDDPDPNEDEDIAKQWNELNLTLMLRKFIEEDRKQGWGIYYPFKSEGLPKYFSGFPWRVYSAMDAKEERDKRDKFGHPTLWKAKSMNPKNTTDVDINVSECVFFNSAQTSDFDGIPAGMDSWDDMIDYVFCKEAHNNFNQRLGNGFMVLPIDANATEDEETAAKNAMKHVRSEVGITLRQSSDNPLKPEWLQPEPGSSFKDSLDKIEEMIATGMGFSLRWLKGDPHGAVESGQTDTNMDQAHLRQIFNTYIPFIKRVLIYHGWIKDPMDIEILPPKSLGMSEMEQAALDQLRTECIGQKQWLTTNEKRILDGYDEVDEDQAEELKSVDEKRVDLKGQELEYRRQAAGAKADAYAEDDQSFDRADAILNAVRPILKELGLYKFDGIRDFVYSYCLQYVRNLANIRQYVADAVVQYDKQKSSNRLGVKHDSLEEDIKTDLSDSVRQLAKKWNCSQGTVSKIRAYYDKQVPALKTDANYQGWELDVWIDKGHETDFRKYMMQFDIKDLELRPMLIRVEDTRYDVFYRAFSPFTPRSGKYWEIKNTWKTDSLEYVIKCDSIVGDVFETEGPLLTAEELQYSDSKLKDYIPPEEIEKWFNSNTPKELHIGITPDDSHPSRVPLEVTLEDSVGVVKAERYDPKLGVIGKYRIDLHKIDEILGAENWVRDRLKEGADLPVSIARWVKEKIHAGKRLNTNLDVRSVVLTQHPRNQKTKALNKEVK